MSGAVAVAAVRVRVPLRRPLLTARGAWSTAESWLIQLRDGDGRFGMGEATLGPGSDPIDQAALDGLVRATLVAAAPYIGPAPDTGQPHGAGGRDAPAAALDAALATAWLDLGHEPVQRPRTAQVQVNAMIGAETLQVAVAAARSAVEAGFTTLKLKGGGEASTAELVGRLGAIRAAVGDAVRLRLDVNGAWDAATALERLLALAPIGLELVEQPVTPGPDAAALLARLRASSGAVIAADESVTSPAAARSLLAIGAVDVLVVKPTRVGGPAAALAIAALAARAGAGTIVSTLLETGVGLRAALVTASLLPPGAGDLAHGLATGPLLASELVRGGGVAVSRGHATCPAAPGLGLSLDRGAIERSAVERLGTWT